MAIIRRSKARNKASTDDAASRDDAPGASNDADAEAANGDAMRPLKAFAADAASAKPQGERGRNTDKSTDWGRTAEPAAPEAGVNIPEGGSDGVVDPGADPGADPGVRSGGCDDKASAEEVSLA